MTNRIFFYGMLGGLFILLAGVLLRYGLNISMGNQFMQAGLGMSHLFGLSLLAGNGTFIISRYFRFFVGFSVVVLFGAWFKILHVPVANILLFVGFAGMIIVYIIHFLKKPAKLLLDYLKLSFIVINFCFAFLFIIHRIGRAELIVPDLLLWSSVILFVVKELKHKTLFSEE